MLKILTFNAFLFTSCPESLNDSSDLTTHNGRLVQVKEEEEETEEKPSKKRRGQSKSQTKTEDIKTEGSLNQTLLGPLDVKQDKQKHPHSVKVFFCC